MDDHQSFLYAHAGNALDKITTYVGLQYYAASEMNPIMGFLQRNLGLMGMLLVMMAYVTFLTFLFYHHKKKNLLLGTILLLFGISNIVVITLHVRGFW